MKSVFARLQRLTTRTFPTFFFSTVNRLPSSAGGSDGSWVLRVTCEGSEGSSTDLCLGISVSSMSVSTEFESSWPLGSSTLLSGPLSSAPVGSRRNSSGPSSNSGASNQRLSLVLVATEPCFDLNIDGGAEVGDSVWYSSSPSSTLGGRTNEPAREVDGPSVGEMLETALARAACCSLRVVKVA